MNKSELISSMAEQTGLSKTDARKALDAFMNCVENALINGDKVSLIGFGTFSIIDKGERKGINPA
ncbi:MAG: HU family DNA-binding protein, partial [Bacteroidales bacterium]